MIDLHTHTVESDGTCTPGELVRAAIDAGLEALGVTDHDTFAGYDQAAPIAAEVGLDLVCGIELSTRFRPPGKHSSKSVHLLGYFLDGAPAPEFRAWLQRVQMHRHDRNRRMAEKLQSMGLDVQLEEVQALGRSLAGRPHFARALLNKGYVSSLEEAFDLYIGESAPGYVERDEPGFAEGVERIIAAGGLPSVAHPIRLNKRNPDAIPDSISKMVDQGLKAIEVFHTDHTRQDAERFLGLAQRHGLAVTGGSDFHGANKPGVRLGAGLNGNVSVPRSVLDDLRLNRAGWRQPHTAPLRRSAEP